MIAFSALARGSFVLMTGDVGIMVDSRHPNTSVSTTKADQLITVTTQAGVTTQDRRLRLGITSSPDGPH